MSSLIYIIAIIIFALVSNRSKFGKPKSGSPPRGGMPTFGGGGDEGPSMFPRRSAGGERPAGKASGFPAPVDRPDRPAARHADADSRGRTEPAQWEGRPERSAPGSGEGLSLEAGSGALDDIAVRNAQMQQEFERLQAAFDAAGSTPQQGSSAREHNPAADGLEAAQTAAWGSLADNRAALRSGVIWAEILGPPRSRKPHSTRRQG
ncbi:hypothetical protein [Paenibacillus tepidiphilus]|uniref:hypothetical protein n=1 Tax=Paenibacillus tepidiphilus TaxID=2608683 RepID=UPI0012397274|nr:hypothetical protein [Paenibacillus tepidiphilus]